MRYLAPFIVNDLKKKMVFLGGPRQCGKTTLAQSLTGQFNRLLYLNWDNSKHRKEILQEKWAKEDALIVFDELHKYKLWKNWIKGIFDVQKREHSFLVTGSARLDLYRRGGDSLLGRYHYWRLHPFTLSEKPPEMPMDEAFRRLMSVGGFPEPFLDGNPREARRWRRERLDRVIQDDIRDLDLVRDVTRLELLVELLRTRVGGPVVYKNLAEDLGVSEPTVKKWIEVLERMYLIFLVYPYSTNLPRSILKPPKVYFYDNGDVDGNDGARFENLVASHLLKTIHFLEDRDGFRYQLRYLRDKEGREVDFVLLKEKKVCEIIEAKWNDDRVSAFLRYYREKLKGVRATQIVGQLDRAYDEKAIRVVSAVDELGQLERTSL